MERTFPAEIEQLRRYHTERREQSVAVTFEKSPVPMLWLDTSVLIDLAKIENGEAIERTRAAKLVKLRSTAQRLVMNQRLICPECDQSIEFEGKRLEDEVNAVILFLAAGARCQPYQGVKDRQIKLGTSAYRVASAKVHIPWSTYFYGDPRDRVSETLKLGVVIDSGLKKPREWIDKAAHDKIALQRSWEELRREFTADGRTFDQQLVLEKAGEAASMTSMVEAFSKRVAEKSADMWDRLGVQGFLAWMQNWGGAQVDAFAALYSYMLSPYYGELPIVDVACRLSADLVVHPPTVKSGDSLDIQHLATVVPVAHYIVTDRAMVDRCERLRLSGKYQTKIYSSRTLDDLISELESL